MKYVTMICRGQLSLWKGHVNKDTKNFIRLFLPKGSPADRGAMMAAIRHLHLAFKGMETEEIYEVLMEQFLRAAAKYDPHYGEKLQRVVEIIENALSFNPCFRVDDIDRHFGSSSHRYLRLLCRRGFLESEKEPGERAVYRRTGTWPPPAEFFNGANRKFR
jgi:hypothetical protein